MRKFQLCFLVGSMIFATGCPKYRPSVDFNRAGFVKQVNDHFTAKQTAYFAALTANDPGTAKLRRNELIEDALPYIDEAYLDFITAIQSGRDRDNFLADVIELGTTAAVGITNGERPLQILGVALTAFRGGRRSADLNFYKEQTTPVLISKMDGNRAKVRTTIITRENEEVSTYPIGTAIGDIVAYYNAGTLVRAFTELQKDTAVATQASEAELDKLKKEAGVRGAVTKEHLLASNEFASAIRDHRRAYLAAKANLTAAESTITTAQNAITDADAAMSQADQDIGTANAQIASAANATARAQAEAAKSTSQAAKSKAETDKLKAQNAKTAAETAKSEAIKARDQGLSKLQAIFEAIAANSKLSPFLSKSVEEDSTLSQDEKARKRAILQRLRQKPTPTDAERDGAVNDYTEILLQFAGTIAEMVNAQPELSNSLREILNANK